MKKLIAFCLLVISLWGLPISAWADGSWVNQSDIVTMEEAAKMVLEENPQFDIAEVRMELFEGKRVWAITAEWAQEYTRSTSSFGYDGFQMKHSTEQFTYYGLTIYEYYIGAADKKLYGFGTCNMTQDQKPVYPKGMAAAKKTALATAGNGQIVGYRTDSELGDNPYFIFEILLGDSLYEIQVSENGSKVLNQMSHKVAVNTNALSWNTLQTMQGELSETKAVEKVLDALQSLRSDTWPVDTPKWESRLKKAVINQTNLTHWGNMTVWSIRTLVPEQQGVYLSKQNGFTYDKVAVPQSVCFDCYVTMDGTVMGLTQTTYERHAFPTPTEFKPEKGLHDIVDRYRKQALIA